MHTSKKQQDLIIKLVNKTGGYMQGVDRQSERVKKTGEIFTPTKLVLEVLSKVPNAAKPGKTVLDPACGDGQFLVTIFFLKVLIGKMTSVAALTDIYGVDIMSDNIAKCRKRLFKAVRMSKLSKYDSISVKNILRSNILTGNTLDPHEEIDGQTEEERKLVIAYFAKDVGDKPAVEAENSLMDLFDEPKN